MTIRHTIYIPAAAVLIGTALPACSSGDDDMQMPDAGSATVGITLSASPLGNTLTRGNWDNFGDDNVVEASANANELIKNWFVAFVQDNTIKAIAEGTPGNSETGVWNDKVNVELPKGTYSAIAFANMNNENLKSKFAAGTSLPEGWHNSIVSSVKNENEVASEEDSLFVSGLVPMSGYLKDFIVKGTVDEKFAIELVRMLCKVEFAVKNMSSQTITIKSFSLNPVYGGDIYLFPKNGKSPSPDSVAYLKPRIPYNDTFHYAVHKKELSDYVIYPDSISERRQFYIKESIAYGIHPTNHFHIGLTLMRGSEEKEDVTYALSADSLKWINRNDYLLFPIVITDYVPVFEVLDYPPIGGYPVNMTSKNNEFYATFSNSGAFDISARLRDSQGRTKAIQEYKEGANQENYVRFVSSTPTGFDLKYEQTLGVWQGNFQHGTNQKIVLTFEFKVGTLIYTRTLHLLSS